MQKTLVERLGLSNQFIEDGVNSQVSLDKRKLSDVEIEILREFYKEDSLAYKVAAGEESYSGLIEPIEENNSFSKIIWTKRTDKNFDNEVKRVIKSMNNVGLRYINPKIRYINPEIFTTYGKKKDDKGVLLHSLKFGVLYFGLAAFGTYNNLENSGIFPKFIPVIVTGMAYLGNKIMRHILFMKPDLKDLRESAQKTDEFLTQHYLKLLSS